MRTFDNALEVLLVGIPKFDVSAEQAVLWRALLADVSPDALYASALQIVRECKFPPSCAEWRERALTIDGAGKPNRMTASAAWDEMYRNRHARHFKVPKWSSEAVRRAAESVQWDNPDWLTEQLPTIRAQFERYYLALADQRDAIDAGQEVLALVDPITRALSKRWTPELGEGQRT